MPLTREYTTPRVGCRRLATAISCIAWTVFVEADSASISCFLPPMTRTNGYLEASIPEYTTRQGA